MKPLVLMSDLAPGGAQRVTVSFLAALARQGMAVPLCTLTAVRDDATLASELTGAGVARVDLAARRLADPTAAWRLRALLRQGAFDLVHAHGQDAGIMAAWARRVGRFQLVVTRHVSEEPTLTWRNRLRASAATAGLRSADAVVAVSRDTAERMVSSGIPADRIHVIPNGIDLARFDTGSDTAAPRGGRDRGLAVRGGNTASNSSNGVPEVGQGTLLILVPAVLREEKGHDVLLDAVPRVLERIPEVVFLLAGDGPLEEEIAARACRLDGAVRLLGHRDDVPALMAAADLVCLPSRSEALPTVLMEAAAAGRPAIASRVGGVPELVEDGRTGVMVPAGDADALAAAIVALAVDPARRRALGRAARERALESFGIETQVRHSLELWRLLVEGSTA